MAKKPSATGEQLRALMQSHIEVAAAPIQPVDDLPQVALSKTVFSGQGRAEIEPGKIPFSKPASATRYSLRLLPTEVAKINSIINSTLHNTGQRATLTDVLRVALGRIGDSSPISKAELAALRSTDARRH